MKTQVTCLCWWVAHVLLVLVLSCSTAFVVGSQHTHAYCIKKLFPIISVILVAQKRYLQKWSYSAAIKCIFHKLTLSAFLKISTMYGSQKWLKELISLSLLIILALIWNLALCELSIIFILFLLKMLIRQDLSKSVLNVI